MCGILNDKNYEQGGLNDYIPYINNPKINNASINLKAYLNLLKSENKGIQAPTSAGSYNFLPSKSLFLDVNTEDIKEKIIVPDKFLSD